ncbi:MAG: nucleotidyltransferase domain-containing protein [Coriobacteriales bacterium]|jgi:predicted nucleotidyltransferase|nr:nucleotidyltransferase domain-containing protein [Coriobacteriales bacterium]
MNEFGLRPEIWQQIQEVLSCDSEVERAVLYGSRARGDYRENSDIDIAIWSPRDIIAKLQVQFDTVPTILKIDLADFNTLANPELKAHIEKDGRAIDLGFTNIDQSLPVSMLAL